ncbi:MAG: AzlD domain-containing protein [Rhizobiaceae bacterium]|nr:AzlD domain-containing protein [Rhizobiaceae bacterium]
MTFEAIDAWWWPYLFIIVAGWLATDAWRFLGVVLGGRISETSEALVFVRAVATALVAAVIASLVLTPNGGLAEAPAWLRVGAVAAGFGVYLVTRQHMLAGIFVAEAVLLIGMALT